MAEFIIRTEELVSMTYRIEAESEQDALDRFEEAEPVHGGETIEVVSRRAEGVSHGDD